MPPTFAIFFHRTLQPGLQRLLLGPECWYVQQAYSNASTTDSEVTLQLGLISFRARDAEEIWPL